MAVYTLKEIKEKLTPLFIKYNIIKASAFGSYARDEAVEHSDINLLILIDEDFELDDYVRFKSEVERTIGKDVDILEYRSINKKLKDEILQEAVLLYDKK